MKTREDAFLGGHLTISQPVDGYRAGADPVLLAAAVPAKPGDSVLELGCGAGTGFLCLGARVSGLSIMGIEKDAAMADLAQANAAANKIEATVLTADVVDLPSSVTERSFDHAYFNPPFFNRNAGSPSPIPSREAGRGINSPTEIWADVALKRLNPGGYLTLINRMDQLPRTLSALGGRAGAIRVLPLQPRHNAAAKLFILNAKKGSKSEFRICPSLVLHQGDRHEKDGDSYTDEVAGVLRKPGALLLDC